MFHDHSHGTTEDTARLIGQEVGKILYLSVDERTRSNHPNEIAYRAKPPEIGNVTLPENPTYMWRAPQDT